MWIEDCEQRLVTDWSKPPTITMLKQLYTDSRGKTKEKLITKTITYKFDEFGNRVKWVKIDEQICT